MRVVTHGRDELEEVVCYKGVVQDFVLPDLALLLVGELSIDEEVCRLQEGRLFSELLNGVSCTRRQFKSSRLGMLPIPLCIKKPLSPSMYVILLLMAAVFMNPGS